MFGWSLLLKVLNCSCMCAQRVLVCPYLPGMGDADYGALTVFLVWQWQAPFGKSLNNLWGYCHGVMLWPQILLSPCYKDVKQDCSPLFSRFEVIIHFLSVGWEENDGKRIWYILAPTFLFLKAQDICGRIISGGLDGEYQPVFMWRHSAFLSTYPWSASLVINREYSFKPCSLVSFGAVAQLFLFISDRLILMLQMPAWLMPSARTLQLERCVPRPP